MRYGLPVIVILIVIILSSCTIRKTGTTCELSNTQHKSFDSIVNAPFASVKAKSVDLLNVLVSCIENQDQSALTSLFAPSITASDTFQQQCADLFAFFDGTMESYEWQAASTHVIKNSSVYRETKVSYDILTAETSYRLSIQYCSKDDQNSKNVGIHSLYIIRFEDTNPKYAYWGDGNWTPGINVVTGPQA